MAKKKSQRFSENLVPALRESIISRINADGTVSIVNLEIDDLTYSLDGIAAEVFASIDGTNSLATIKQNIIEKHSPPKNKFGSDFESLVRELAAENLITIEKEPGAEHCLD